MKILFGGAKKTRKQSSLIDEGMLGTFVILIGFGLVMIYSASSHEAFSAGDSYFYLYRHLTYMILGLIVFAVAMQIPSKIWQIAAPWLVIFGILLLSIVLVPGIGKKVNGAQRWLAFAGFTFQPSELMKLFMVLYAADFAVRKSVELGDFQKGFLPMLATLGVTGSLLLFEPDFGACFVITSVAVFILFLGGLNWRFLTSLVLLSGCVFGLLIFYAPYRLARVTSFMNPLDFLFGSGYQLSHSLFAFARGDWLGVGLGRSMEKLFYLPEAHNDFILAVIGEELGFLGVVFTITLFVVLVIKGFVIGTRAAVLERCFASLVAHGISIWIAAQALISMGVNLGLLPTKGLTLPFLSFGGSALLVNCLAIGILFRVDWENRQMMKGIII